MPTEENFEESYEENYEENSEEFYQLVLCTCPDLTTAREIATRLVDARLAACVNILPGVESVYRWQDQRESAQEILLLIKTTQDAYPALEKTITELHPYELPEVIAVSLSDGLAPYLDWIDDSLSQP
jgi:periplasmic divalent cation tolerance protein